MIYLEMMVVMAFALLFSCFTTPTISAMCAIFVYVGGQLTADIKLLGPGVDHPIFRQALELIYYLLPNLQYFNLKAEVIHGVPLDPEALGYVILYGVCYTATVLMVALFVLQRREFR